MLILTLRLFLTPLLIAGASLAGRRWGPGVSGWLIGFPIISAPISVILALQFGPDLTVRAGIGTLGGLASLCVFFGLYSLISRRGHWALCVTGATLGFLVATLFWNSFTLSLLPTFVIVVAVIAMVLALVPLKQVTRYAPTMPAWDLPARMLIAALFVLLLSALTSVLGPQLSGLITPFPIFGTILAVFAHRQQGARAAVQLLRGLVLSLFGVAVFFLVVCLLLLDLGIVWTYTLASLATITMNSLTFRLARAATA